MKVQEIKASDVKVGDALTFDQDPMHHPEPADTYVVESVEIRIVDEVFGDQAMFVVFTGVNDGNGYWYNFDEVLFKIIEE